MGGFCFTTFLCLNTECNVHTVTGVSIVQKLVVKLLNTSTMLFRLVTKVFESLTTSF
jgi:hypothetical protein